MLLSSKELDCMSKKNLRILERLFWWAGWSLILLMAFQIVGYSSEFLIRKTIADEQLFGNAWQLEFRLSSQLQSLFELHSAIFFSFLIASVFRMIRIGRVVDLERSERFLKLACIGFVGTGLLSLVPWLSNARLTVGALFSDGSFAANIWNLVSMVIATFTCLVPFMYAITLYVLFRHFSGMVKFQSEVV